jgi:uncharacterized protein YydD (DUF2326 family)
MRLNMSEQTVSSLEQTKSTMDTGLVSQLYAEAKHELPKLNKKLEDVLNFHNKMITNKISFVRRSIIETMKQLQSKDANLRIQLDKEREILQAVAKKGALTDLQKQNSELSDLREQRGQKEALVKKLEEIIKDLGEVRDLLIQADNKLLAYKDELDKKLNQFNIIFSDYSKRLYGEEYVLSYDTKEGKHGTRFDFRIANVRGNEGTGKKRAQVTALDLSYLQFLAKTDAKTIRFTLHDRVEEIDANQLKTLFEIANSINGQYVVAVLRDKLQGIEDAWIEQNTILKLSQQDKFFKLL